MSRGGRGGFRGGKIGGAEVPWAYDPDIKPDYKPSELFPVVEQPKPTSLTQRERLQVARFRAFRSRVHEGPLYTVLGPSRVGKQGGAGPAVVDPFEGMPTYTHRYRKKTRTLPRLDTRPYVLEFFPKELWSTLDPDHAKENGPEAASRNQSKKILKLSRPSLEKELFDDDVDDDEEMDADDADDAHLESPKRTSRRSKGGDEDEDDRDKAAGDNALDDEDQEGDEEEVDDDFEENEEEMGEDYNAEAYFQDGRDDDGDDYDGGGGDDDGGYM